MLGGKCAETLAGLAWIRADAQHNCCVACVAHTCAGQLQRRLWCCRICGSISMRSGGIICIHVIFSYFHYVGTRCIQFLWLWIWLCFRFLLIVLRLQLFLWCNWNWHRLCYCCHERCFHVPCFRSRWQNSHMRVYALLKLCVRILIFPAPHECYKLESERITPLQPLRTMRLRIEYLGLTVRHWLYVTNIAWVRSYTPASFTAPLMHCHTAGQRSADVNEVGNNLFVSAWNVCKESQNSAKKKGNYLVYLAQGYFRTKITYNAAPSRAVMPRGMRVGTIIHMHALETIAHSDSDQH